MTLCGSEDVKIQELKNLNIISEGFFFSVNLVSRPEMTLCGSEDVKIQQLTSRQVSTLLRYKPYQKQRTTVAKLLVLFFLFSTQSVSEIMDYRTVLRHTFEDDTKLYKSAILC